MTAEAKKVIPADELEAFSTSLLEAGGFSRPYARQSAELLVWANLRGAESHGVLRIPRYIEMLDLKLVKGDASPTFAHEFGAIAVIDGDWVPGASGMTMAADKAAELARKFGIGMCSIMQTSHAGAVGYFAEYLTKKGLVGIAMSASKPLMVYHGAKEQGVSTNPIAIGLPSSDPEKPVVLDMSTAAVALGKIMAAKDAGRPIPADWGVDANGKPTTDPAKVTAVMPMAGPKGSGLSLMIEMLVSVLGGHPLISVALTQKRDAGFNGSVIAIDPKAFGHSNGVGSGVDELAEAIKSLPPADGVDEVLLPGERGLTTTAARRSSGIPLAAGTAKRLVEEAKRLSVSVPEQLF